MLDLLLSLITSVSSLWWLYVPIIVMGIFAIICRIVLRHF